MSDVADREKAAVAALREAGRDMMADTVQELIDQQRIDSPEFDEGQGWRVLDADGNVVSSGGISIAQADGQLAGLIAALSSNEGEQE